jgi:hypothetical protein
MPGAPQAFLTHTKEIVHVLFSSFGASRRRNLRVLCPGSDQVFQRTGNRSCPVRPCRATSGWGGRGTSGSDVLGIGINILLAKDYKKNSLAEISIRMASEGTLCNLALSAPGTVRIRLVTLAEVTEGRTLKGSSPFITPSFPIFVSKSFTLRRPVNAMNNNQKPGDNNQRDATFPGDTCNSKSTVITSAKVTYTTN